MQQGHNMRGHKLWKLRKTHGRKKKYETAEDLWTAACKYFQWCENNPVYETHLLKQGLESVTGEVEKPRPYTKQGLCIHIGICWTTYFLYEKDEALKEVTETINNIIFDQKFSYAAIGVFNHALIARDLGMVDKQELSGDPDKPLLAASSRLKDMLDRVSEKNGK